MRPNLSVWGIFRIVVLLNLLSAGKFVRDGVHRVWSFRMLGQNDSSNKVAHQVYLQGVRRMMAT